MDQSEASQPPAASGRRHASSVTPPPATQAAPPPVGVIHTPPPITGYRGLSEADVAAMNEIKAKANEVETLIVRMRAIGADPRWVAIAETDLQKGFMSLTRAIAKPTSF